MLSKKSNKKSKEFKMFDFVSIGHVHDFGNGSISFNADFGIDGLAMITIYNLTWREGKRKDGTEYKFVSMPQEKGSDGNYYNRVYFPISDDLQDRIEMMLAEALDQ